MESQPRYSISPDLLNELDDMKRRLENRLVASDVTPADVDWFRYKGVCLVIDLIKNNVFGIDRDTGGSDIENQIIRHDKKLDTPTTYEDEE